MKVLGIVNSSGNYEGRNYHNLVLHVSYQETNANKDFKGLMVDTVKLKYSDLDVLLNMGLADPSDVERMNTDSFAWLIGKDICVAYNKFGQVQSVDIIDEKSGEVVTPKTANKK